MSPYIDPKKAQKSSNAGFDFDFNDQTEKRDEEPKVEDNDQEDFFGNTKSNYLTQPQDDWFDNSGSKPKAKVEEKKKVEAKPQKAKDDDFDFNFNAQSSKPTSKASPDFFDFGNDSKPQKSENVFDDFGQPDLIGPKKPQFEDYFPEENDDENVDQADSGLISNLKKLYQKDGVGVEEKNTSEDILQPEIIQPKEEFTPEVKVKGQGFWEERKNPHLAQQQTPNYHHLSVLGSPQVPGQYGQAPAHGVGGGNLHLSKSSNALAPPTEFPTMPGGHLNIHRSHSSDESKAKKSQPSSGVFGDLYQTSMGQVQK